ncbi:MAG TPA: serine/threonine-protein kinase [Pyrinomonadaceae bacterium]|nr:serine/threonine-protein kinase [Pyrinomonadaceae bacterium]
MAKTGDTIGPYTLVRKLGRGAFGVVWLAEKRTVLATTQVALKFPNDEELDLDAVKQEASLWVRASGHPNVLTFIDADMYDGQVVIVSEYAPDGSLARWLEAHRGRAPSVAAAVEMCLGILAGLEHLHKRGIIHRDIKPDNILLQHDSPRLADFGIARILKTTSKSTVATGTPAYMSPEAFDGKRNERTDIWSVGVIFYQLLAGRLPFPQADMPSLLMAIVTRDPEPLPASIPEQLRDLVKRALEKEPEARFQSAAEMRQALLKARTNEPPSPIADLPTQHRPQEGHGVTPHGLAQPSIQDPPPPKRRSWIITLPISLIAFSGVVLLFTYWSNRTQSTAYKADVVAEQTPSVSTNVKEEPTPSPFQSSRPTATPTPPPSTTVRLRLLYTGASAYSAADGVPVTLQSSTQNFSGATNGQGFITFESVPCDEEVEINFRSDAVDRKLLRIKSYLNCGTSLNDLGIFSATFGEKLGHSESDLDGPVLN